MEAKMAETSSVKKRKQLHVDDVAQLVKTKLAQLNKKPRRHVVNLTKTAQERECHNGAVRAAKDEDDKAVCACPRSSGSDHVDDDDGGSCCSNNGCSELVEDGGNKLKFVDLKEDGDDEEGDEVESQQTYNPLRERRRQMAPSTNLQPQPTPAEPRRKKMPTELELEEFFTAAEKDVQSKFAKKYNYDVAKDEPLEGRYEWTRIKP